MAIRSLALSPPLSLLVGLLLLAGNTAHAQATCELPLAAYLTDGAGAALDGAIDLTLTFYDGPDVEALAMDCREVSVSADQGWVRTSLDACGLPVEGACGVLSLRQVLEAGLEAGGEVYVGIEVDSAGVELDPRVLIGSAPFALFASHADTATASESAAEADSLAGFDPSTPLALVECDDGEVLVHTAGTWSCSAPPTSSTALDSVGPTTLDSSTSLELLGDGAPRLLAQAWEVRVDAVAPILFADAPYACQECGDGSEGAFEVPPLTPTVSLDGGIHNFTTFEVPFGTTLEVTGDETLIVRATEWVIIDGVIDLDARGSTGGPGGDTSSSSSGFGGAGGTRRTDFLVEALIDVTTLRGGGAGVKLDSVRPSHIGGGGGGAIAIVAPRIILRGVISATGGDGGGGGSEGGGGAGGSVWLRGTYIELAGTMSLTGGEGVSDGGEGLARIDARERERFADYDYNTGDLSDLPQPLHVWQRADGTIEIRNSGPAAVEVILSGE